MDDEKVYRPTEIPDNPFPGDPEARGSETGTPDAGVSTAEKIPDKGFPVKRTAVELISSALNTVSRKILQMFELTQSGGMQIGQHEPGVSGDIRITPAGIVARDTAGNTTIGIDGETGNVVIAGELRSGSVVTGDVVVGNNSVIIDGVNRRIIVNDGATDLILIGFGEGLF